MSQDSDLERLVAGVWAEVLNLAHVDPDDDLLDLGGSSLDAVRIVGRLEEDLGVELSVRTVLETGTVRGTSERIREVVITAREELRRQQSPTSPGSP